LSVLTWGCCDDGQVVMAMYTSRDDNERKQINAFMTAFQQHPQAWSRVDTILEQTKCDQSKFFVSFCVHSRHHPTCLCCCCCRCDEASLVVELLDGDVTVAIEQALATLETCVKQRWKVLPADQRENIKSYIVSVIVRCDSYLSPMP
jgi:hypothetical protein